ncbi:carboxypeptidase regulatory-like domain-containing protein [Acidobacteriota bacterium]
MKRFSIFLIFVLLFATSVLSQVKGGDINGTVLLSDGTKIPGVQVTATSPQNGTQTTVTSATGNYRLTNLPPGEYKLKFELEGFATVEKDNVQVRIGKDENIQVQMEIHLEETITITGKIGVIDVRKSTADVSFIFPYSVKPPLYDKGPGIGNYSIDDLSLTTIPAARNPWTVLSALPGVMVDRVDVGPSDSGGLPSVVRGGYDPNDTVWYIDGFNITNPADIGSAAFFPNLESFESIQVSTGGSDITSQTAGVQIHLVTKKGTSALNGSGYMYFEGFDLNRNPTPAMQADSLNYPTVDGLFQSGLNLGGPIIEDKLWFFSSYGIQNIDKVNEPGFVNNSRMGSGFGKLDFQLGPTQGNFQVFRDGRTREGLSYLPPAQHDDGSLWDENSSKYMFYGGLEQTFGELMLNVKVVYIDGGFSLDPRGADINAATGHNEGQEFKVVDDFSRIEGSIWHKDKNWDSTNISLDGGAYFQALSLNHDARFGIDYYSARNTRNILAPNQRVTFIMNDDSLWEHIQIQPDQLFDLDFKRISFYVQDTTTFGKLTASVGVRYDKETGSVNNSIQPGFTWYEPGSTHHGETMLPDLFPNLSLQDYEPDTAWEMISPRISLTYDITGDGKNIVKLSAGRYMSQSGNRLTETFVPDRWGMTWFYDENQDEIPQYTEIWQEIPYYNAPDSLNRITYDSDYNSPVLTELTLMFEKALSDDLFASIAGFYKKRSNLAFDIDSSGALVPVRRGILPDGSTETKANWEQTDTVMVGGTQVPVYGQIQSPVGWFYTNLDRAYDRYLGLEFQIQKRLSDNYMIGGSFTFQDWKMYRFEDETLDMNNFNYFNEGVVAPTNANFVPDSLWINSRWMFKLHGLYQLPWGINVTGSFLAREGNPQPYRREAVLNQGSTFLYPTGKKIGDDRLPTFWMMNLGLEKTFAVKDTVTATLVVDWYNVTNNQIVLLYNPVIGTDTLGTPDPVMWSNAGLFQFGVRVNF